MRPFVAFLLAFLPMVGSWAQDWGLNWIRAPWANATEQVWFSRSFSLNDMPQRARVEMASSGHFILYVNDYNVTTSLLEPFDQHGPDTIHVVSYDVRPFLRLGNNTLRVWFSPTCNSPKQLSLLLVADTKRKPLTLTTDGNWLCAPAHARTYADGHEEVDGRFHITRPTPTATWQPSQEVKKVNSSFRMPHFIGHLPYEVRAYTCSMSEPDTTFNNVCTYHCGLRFEGRVRVTLTGMKAGDTLRINRHLYICNGRDGEQAQQRFAVGESGEVRIEGPAHFSSKNVEMVEAILFRPQRVRGVRPYPAGHEAVFDDDPPVFLDLLPDED